MKVSVSLTTDPAVGVVTLSVGAVVSRVRCRAVTVPCVPPTLGMMVTVLLPSPAGSVIWADQVLRAAVGSSTIAWTVVPPMVMAIACEPVPTKRA